MTIKEMQDNVVGKYGLEAKETKERKVQESKPPEKRGIMNEGNYLKIKEFLENAKKDLTNQE